MVPSAFVTRVSILLIAEALASRADLIALKSVGPAVHVEAGTSTPTTSSSINMSMRMREPATL